MRRSGIFLLALTLAGCATLQGRSGPARAIARPQAQSAATEVTEAQVKQLQRQAAMAEAEIKLLRRQLAALEVEVERLSSEPEPSPPAPVLRSAPVIMPRVETIESSDLEPVRIEPWVMESEIVEPEVEELEVEEPEVEEPVAVALETPAPRPPTSTAAVPLTGQSIYDRGYTLYHQGRFIDAESSFQRFLQAHGDTELADNAQFWIGESRFAREDHMGALLAFQEVLDRYPGGNKIADAMLKAGDCLVHLDNREGGLQRYEEVLRRFPGSAAAAMAEERLNRPGG